jgi:hypothetical protein
MPRRPENTRPANLPAVPPVNIEAAVGSLRGGFRLVGTIREHAGVR